jgi:RNA polymerase sigma factor (TIGR02999 family)
MSDSSAYQKKIDELLKAHSSGDPAAIHELMPLIYDELRWLAQSNLKYKPESQTLRTTALVNEAYIKLVGRPSQDWKNRAYFFSLAAQLMREILIRHLRDRQRLKRGGHYERQDMDLVLNLLPDTEDKRLLMIDEALYELARVDKTAAEVVVRRYYAGLTVEETAQDMDIAPATVKRKWTFAQAWLSRELTQ